MTRSEGAPRTLTLTNKAPSRDTTTPRGENAGSGIKIRQDKDNRNKGKEGPDKSERKSQEIAENNVKTKGSSAKSGKAAEAGLLLKAQAVSWKNEEQKMITIKPHANLV